MEIAAKALEGFFIVQLLCCLVMFCHALPQRRRFLARTLINSFVLIVVWVLIVFFYPRDNFGWELRYLVIFALSIVGINLCFRLTWNKSLYCAVAAYAVQHLADRISFLIWIGVLQLMKGAEALPQTVVFLSGHLLTMTALIVAGYFLLARHIRQEEKIGYSGGLQLCIIVFFLFGAIFLGQAFDFSYAFQDLPIFVNFSLCDIVIMLLIIILQFNLFQFGQLKNEMDEMEKVWAREKQQMELRRETVELINVKCHDLKYSLSRMRGKLDKEETKTLEGTGSAPLDLLIAERKLLFEKEQIAFTCMTDGALLAFMSEADVYSLFGNMFDNALEALRGLPRGERTLHLDVKRRVGRVFICMENAFAGELRFTEDGLPVTTKQKKEYHGFGTRSISLIAKKYGGTCVMSARDGVFRVGILLPQPSAHS